MISDERLFLESVTGIDIDRLALNAYAQVSAETGLLIDEVAANGYCVECSVPMVSQLNAHFEPKPGFRAYGAIYDINDDMDHCYASVETPRGSPFDDIVIDPTYRQFLDPTDLRVYPNVFVGSRDAAISLMLRHALDPASHVAYRPDMMNRKMTGMFNRVHGLSAISC